MSASKIPHSRDCTIALINLYCTPSITIAQYTLSQIIFDILATYQTKILKYFSILTRKINDDLKNTRYEHQIPELPAMPMYCIAA